MKKENEMFWDVLVTRILKNKFCKIELKRRKPILDEFKTLHTNSEFRRELERTFEEIRKDEREKTINNHLKIIREEMRCVEKEFDSVENELIDEWKIELKKDLLGKTFDRLHGIYHIIEKELEQGGEELTGGKRK